MQLSDVADFQADFFSSTECPICIAYLTELMDNATRMILP